jgi:hypothetical protein
MKDTIVFYATLLGLKAIALGLLFVTLIQF